MVGDVWCAVCVCMAPDTEHCAHVARVLLLTNLYALLLLSQSTRPNVLVMCSYTEDAAFALSQLRKNAVVVPVE